MVSHIFQIYECFFFFGFMYGMLIAFIYLSVYRFKSNENNAEADEYIRVKIREKTRTVFPDNPRDCTDIVDVM